jgi:superoxide reductase
MALKYIKCEICGNLAELIDDSGVIPECCGQEMTELIPNTTDAAQEKHVPVIERNGNTVTVKIGSVTHPMTPEHHIEWIVVEQGAYVLRKALAVTDAPEAVFTLPDVNAPIVAYEYCNLHGLWKSEG